MDRSRIQSNRETTYFVISLTVSILVYILALVSIIGIAVALIVFAFMLFANAMMLGFIRGNGVRIHERQFPDVYESVQALSKEMGLKKVPDVFVVQSEGALNAFATRFWGRDMVVLYSEVFELAREQGTDELNFIIAHELAHVKRRHVWKNLLIMPAGFIPFLSQAYSRSCEYTCDRHAAFVIQNAAASKRALTLLGIGKKLYAEVNEEAYREQIETESNGLVWLSEVLSSHPRLPKRIQAIQQFEQNGGRIYSPNQGKIVLSALLMAGALTAVYFVSILLFAGGSMAYSGLLSSGMEDPFALNDDFYSIEGQTDLMVAANDGDLAGAEQALANGDDIHAKDSEGADALMYAIYIGDLELISYLLEAGADANTADDYSTGLGVALINEDYQTALKLMEYGADPNARDGNGMTALDIFGVSSEQELKSALESGI
ncbi:M48 family metallopeptidase [Planococcus sp. YIM B11945]|uniref:M48 family metallopeptidase n=1 Tax=Planococcus sp. YIM B11945 TaxID=3435410 RepID=UPI003D7CA927